jgi:hypothetical protein
MALAPRTSRTCPSASVAANHGLAAGFNDAGANEQTLCMDAGLPSTFEVSSHRRPLTRNIDIVPGRTRQRWNAFKSWRTTRIHEVLA